MVPNDPRHKEEKRKENTILSLEYLIIQMIDGWNEMSSWVGKSFGEDFMAKNPSKKVKSMEEVFSGQLG